MKTLGRTILLLGALLMFVGPAQASTWYTAPPLPWFGTVNVCIGGGRCEGTDNTMNISFGGSQYIRQVTVYAHDNVGRSTSAELIVYVDGVWAGRLDVQRNGSYLTFPIYKAGSRVTFQSVHQSNDPGGDETFIRDIRIE